MAGGIEGASQTMARGWTVEIVRHIVFARPHQLHRLADDLRDLRRLGRKVGQVAAAKSAPHQGCVYGDLLRRELQHSGNGSLYPIWRLCRCPHLSLALAGMHGYIHWL